MESSSDPRQAWASQPSACRMWIELLAEHQAHPWPSLLVPTHFSAPSDQALEATSSLNYQEPPDPALMITRPRHHFYLRPGVIFAQEGHKAELSDKAHTGIFLPWRQPLWVPALGAEHASDRQEWRQLPASNFSQWKVTATNPEG